MVLNVSKKGEAGEHLDNIQQNRGYEFWLLLKKQH